MHNALPYLNIQESITYFSVFDGFDNINAIKSYENIFQSIEHLILKDYKRVQKEFPFNKIDLDSKKMLNRIAIGNRKNQSIYKDFSQFKGRNIYKNLMFMGIIEQEYSREKPIKKSPKQILKKELRSYRIEHKIKFKRDFHRFWFTFIYPNIDLLEKKEYTKVLEIIKDKLDYYVSLTFEDLSNELIKSDFQNQILDSGSYWDKYIELDLLIKFNNGTLLAGECKWTNHKISKNILNKLQKKTQKSHLDIHYFALFCKNSFSNELLNNRKKEILLYELKDFERLLK